MEGTFITIVAVAAGIALIFYSFLLILTISIYIPAIIGSTFIVYGFIIQSKYFGVQKPWDMRFIKIGIGLYYFSNFASIYFNAGEFHKIDYLIAVRSLQDFSFFFALLVGLSYASRRFADFIFDYQADMANQGKANHNRRERAEQRRQKANENNGENNDQRRHDQNDSTAKERTALAILRLTKPFTLAQLKEQRNEMLKRNHPDKGGSNEIASLINQAYELLKSKASDA